MSRWLRRAARPEWRDPGAQWTGPALVDAAARLAPDDVAHARAVAFAVAEATREGDDDALRALSVLLSRSSAISVLDESTLVNVLSALHFASMLPEDVRGGWLPPTDAVARAIELASRSGEVLRDQTDGLLWALLDRRLAADWLGRENAQAVASRVISDLREQVVSQLHTHEPVISLVAGGEEFPCLPA